MRPIFVLFCLMAATACDEKVPTAVTIPIDQQFTLAPGEAAVIEATGLRVQFVRVTGDSRCPADAICIQGGDAVVVVRAVEAGASREYELHTGNSEQAAVDHGGTRISLVQLQPYPFSSRPTQPSDYRATLEVRR
jgi:hypothetical protein